MFYRSHVLFVFISVAFLAFPAQAQTDQASDRVDRLERDIQLLQRQLARGEPITVDNGAPITNANQLEGRLTAIEDQMRELRGNIEQVQNEVRRVSENFDRFQKDIEFRLNQSSPAPQASVAPPSPAASKAVASDASTETTDSETTEQPAKKTDALKTSFNSPRDHYNYAFRLLNQTQYEQAAKSFDDFVKKHPKDPLSGNAYYWGGETYYIRRDYVKSADYFRQGYEAMPEGPKAADNLYKLALSLNALDRGKEACIVLQQVVAKFKRTSTNISAKAEQEIKSSGCSSKP